MYKVKHIHEELTHYMDDLMGNDLDDMRTIVDNICNSLGLKRSNPTQRKLQGGLHTSQRSRRPQHTNKPAGFQPRVPDTKNSKLQSETQTGHEETTHDGNNNRTKHSSSQTKTH